MPGGAAPGECGLGGGVSGGATGARCACSLRTGGWPARLPASRVRRLLAAARHASLPPPPPTPTGSSARHLRSTPHPQIANLVTTAVGAGMLALPCAVQKTGVLLGAALFALVAGLTFASCSIIVRRARRRGRRRRLRAAPPAACSAARRRPAVGARARLCPLCTPRRARL